MKKAVLYLVPIIFVVLSVFLMTGGRYLKAPLGQSDDVVMYIHVLREDIVCEKWDKALDDAEGLESAWKTVMPRIQFSSERNEIERISINISRIKGSIMARDIGGVLAELSEADRHFNELE